MFITRLKELINERNIFRLMYLVKIIDLLAATVGSTQIIQTASELSVKE
jgi:hypothetical protein